MNVDRLLSHSFPRVTQSYDDNFTMLYGLSVGLAADPLDPRQLPYVYEQELRTFPTMSVVLATPGFWSMRPEFEISWRQVLHGEQELIVHRPLPVAGTVAAQLRITAIDDKGAAKGALIHSERTLVEAGSGQPLATLRQTTFARADGGFGGENPPRVTGWTRPTRDPDHACSLPTARNGALLYRLTGDRNPLHADPAVARVAGFDEPILHGLCTYGVIAHALVRTLANYDAERLRRLAGRFSSPVVPGEVITTSIWEEPNGMLFEATATDGRVVFTHGRAEVAS
jgi:acyl dehydratase